MPLARRVQDLSRFSYTFSELSLFCRIFAEFSVIFPYYLEINNIIYKIFGYVENRVASGPGGHRKDLRIKEELCLNFKAELDIALHHSSLCGYILPQYTIYIAAGTLACISSS